MAEHRRRVMEALASVYDPCCQEKGLSVVDMGRSARSTRRRQARVEAAAEATGWCPFAANLVSQITERVAALPGRGDRRDRLGRAVDSDRLSDKARRTLRFLPHQGGWPMIGAAIVFDGGPCSASRRRTLQAGRGVFINHLYAFRHPHPRGRAVMPAEEFLRQWT
jgi:metal-sulfur cluster biosynthetic enzyme